MDKEKKGGSTVKKVIRLLVLMQTPRSREEIARELGLSERGVYRYLRVLKEAGVAVGKIENKYCLAPGDFEVRLKINDKKMILSPECFIFLLLPTPKKFISKEEFSLKVFEIEDNIKGGE